MKKMMMATAADLLLLSACHDQATNKETNTDTIKGPENTTMMPVSSCYASTSNGDSVQMKVDVFEKVVTGTLQYNWKEKDDNKGEYEGVMKGDTLFADYRFMSEGKESTRQVAFLIKDGTATEGYGDVEEKDGKTVFKNPSALQFGKDIVLSKTQCNY